MSLREKAGSLHCDATDLVQDERVLDIVSRVRHDGDGRVLSCRELVVSDELDRLCLDHRLLRVDHQVEQGVDSVELVVGDRSDRLLSHRALVRVSRGLVVMRVGDETGDGSEDGEGLDLEVGRAGDDEVLVQRDERVVLLVTVEVLNQSTGEKVVKRLLARLEVL